MKYLQISTVMSYGSIGRIMRQNYDEKSAKGWECLIAYGRGSSVSGYNTIRIGTDFDVIMQGIETRLLDRHGYGSRKATHDFLRQIDKWEPDVIHLHNIHGYYINFEVLFNWLKMHPERRVIWTLHDCWSMTGHCTHFIAVNCNQWISQCRKCSQLRQYPECLLCGNVVENYDHKKTAFTNVSNMEIEVPSKWLEGVVKQSFLKDYHVRVVNNVVDRIVFKPTQSDFREKNNIIEKKIILGVANIWNERKGLKDFIKLESMLDDKYVIVMIGLTDKQIKKMPYGIVCIKHTNNVQELAGIYSTADVFVNLTYEDTYPMVNMEAEACGTKVITYSAGGAQETIHRNDSVVVTVGDIDSVFSVIVSM